MFRRNFENEVDQLLDICLDNGIGVCLPWHLNFIPSKIYHKYYIKMLQNDCIKFCEWLLDKYSIEEIEVKVEQNSENNNKGYIGSWHDVLRSYWKQYKKIK